MRILDEMESWSSSKSFAEGFTSMLITPPVEVAVPVVENDLQFAFEYDLMHWLQMRALPPKAPKDNPVQLLIERLQCCETVTYRCPLGDRSVYLSRYSTALFSKRL